MAKYSMIREIMQIPFLEKGRDELGADCWGIVLVYYQKVLGITLPSYSGVHLEKKYAGKEGVVDILSELSLIEQFEQVCEPQKHDIVMLNIADRPVHVGVMIDSDRFMHTSKQSGVVIENIKSARWSSRVENFYRWRY